MPHSIGRTVILHKDDFAYNSHPSIAVLDNGEWLAVFGTSRRRDPIEHPPSDPLFRNLLVRTADGWRFKERVLYIDESLRDDVFGHVW